MCGWFLRKHRQRRDTLLTADVSQPGESSRKDAPEVAASVLEEGPSAGDHFQLPVIDVDSVDVAEGYSELAPNPALPIDPARSDTTTLATPDLPTPVVEDAPSIVADREPTPSGHVAGSTLHGTPSIPVALLSEQLNGPVSFNS